jgi:hypothetical protein
MGGAGEKNIFNHGESLLWNRSDTATIAVLKRNPVSDIVSEYSRKATSQAGADPVE